MRMFISGYNRIPNHFNTLRVDAKIFVSAKEYLQKKNFPDTCGHGLNLKEHFSWLVDSPCYPNVTDPLLVTFVWQHLPICAQRNENASQNKKFTRMRDIFPVFFLFLFRLYYLFKLKQTRHELLQNKYRFRFFLKWFLIFISTIVELKQVLLSTSLLLRIKNRSLDRSTMTNFLPTFTRVKKYRRCKKGCT